MPEQSQAWLMNASGGESFALADYELIEYIVAPQLIEIPLTPAHCHALILWREQLVPVINFADMLQREDNTIQSVSIVAYQQAPEQALHYLGICLQQAPEKILVSDEQACALGERNQDLWQILAASCFEHQGEAVPVLDLARLESVDFDVKARSYHTLDTAEVFSSQQGDSLEA